jgi:hypothetical protein
MSVALSGVKNLRVNITFSRDCWDWFSRILVCLRDIMRDMPLVSLYYLEVVVLSRCFHWGFVHCTTLSCLFTHFQDGLQFIHCYRVHAVKSAKKRFALFSSALFTIEFRFLRKIYINSVPTSQETHYVSATKTIRLTLFEETIAVSCENQTEELIQIYIYT